MDPLQFNQGKSKSQPVTERTTQAGQPAAANQVPEPTQQEDTNRPVTMAEVQRLLADQASRMKQSLNARVRNAAPQAGPNTQVTTAAQSTEQQDTGAEDQPEGTSDEQPAGTAPSQGAATEPAQAGSAYVNAARALLDSSGFDYKGKDAENPAWDLIDHETSDGPTFLRSVMDAIDKAKESQAGQGKVSRMPGMSQGSPSATPQHANQPANKILSDYYHKARGD